MKVFGGNGRRENNSNRDSGEEKSSGAERKYINNGDGGYNNAEVPEKAKKPVGKPPKKGKAGKVVLIVLIVIAAVVAGVYIWWKTTAKPPESAAVSPDSAQSGSETDESPEPTAQVLRYYTLLVVGIDQLQANTDTIMLVRYDTQENKANIVSIPRDTLVNVSDPVKKINAVYSYAEEDNESGIDALEKEVAAITGFTPDNYVMIDTNVFVQAINDLGGVYFDVPVNMDYDDVTPSINYEFHIHVQKGYQYLDGENALGVFRFRKNNDGTGYAMGDIDRLETQHELIKAVAEQALQLKNITKLVEIAKLVSDNSDTDLTLSNLQWYAQEFMKMSTDNISISTMPTTGCWINGLAYVTINVDDWIDIINEQLNPLDREITEEDCSIMCQKYTESDNYSYTPGNYYTTDGEQAYTNFYKFTS